MRDPKRIDKFCRQLASIWKMVPDWRFGQLIFNAFSEMNMDPFYKEDEDMLEYLENYVKKNSPYFKED